LARVSGLLRDIRLESSTIQFDHEVGTRLAKIAEEQGMAEAVPGVDRPTVDVLGLFALVMPEAEAPPLRCMYMNHLSAFLDRRFREYDFRRGAADARRLIEKLLGIADYPKHPASYYQPDNDPAERDIDIADYATLSAIASSRKPNRSVRAVFEEALAARVGALVRCVDWPGPDFVVAPLVSAGVKTFVRSKLPGVWNPDRASGGSAAG
jgi:hypothetical protein